MYGKSRSKTGCILKICFSTFQRIQPIHGETGGTLLKMQKKKGPKWKKVDLEGPDLANEKKVRTLYYINFSSRIQPCIQKYQKPVKKALKNAISDFPHFHPVFQAL